MNIFYLDRNPVRAARLHCDKHVVKMILESAQMLCTAHRQLDGDTYADTHSLYKNAHINHPSTKWTRSGDKHYLYLYDLFVALCEEYTHRYGKTHTTDFKLRGWLAKMPTNIPSGQFTDPPQCMPDQYKNTDTVLAYQQYYVGEKAGFAKWKDGNIPDFMHKTAGLSA